MVSIKVNAGHWWLMGQSFGVFSGNYMNTTKSWGLYEYTPTSMRLYEYTPTSMRPYEYNPNLDPETMLRRANRPFGWNPA